MPNQGKNEGISQTGNGTIINSGAMAVGRNARARTEGGQTPEEAVASLRELLAAHRTELTDENRAGARGELEDIADELNAPEPDRSRIDAALSRLSSAVSSIGALANGVAAIGKALGCS